MTTTTYRTEIAARQDGWGGEGWYVLSDDGSISGPYRTALDCPEHTTMATPTTLDDLCDTLTECPSCRAGDDDESPHTCGGLDWTALPTFGGAEPRDTSGVWSWDEGRLLVGTCGSDLRIVSRNDA